ncbi:MAG: hypothetical protein ICV83_00965, partial [Cytophagales bacterium]|nr:hypothetical protein [Cytophagales bacterium]
RTVQGQTLTGYSNLEAINATHGNSHIPFGVNGAVYLSGTGFIYRSFTNGVYNHRFTIDGSGNVGIGGTATTNNARLFVTQAAPTNGSQVSIFNPVAGAGQVAGIRLSTASGWNVMLRTNQGNAWLELTDAGGSWAHRWDGGHYYTMGSVNIGTTTLEPAYKLSVAGAIRAREVKVTVTGLSDYVFSPAYRLRPLSEVEAYVKQNGHLPEVPSAVEVTRDGMNVGEMENTLLKKVEELTLYVIEQQKQIQALQQQLERKERR